MKSPSNILLNIIAFIKKELILTIAILLAVISMFIIPPSADYADYIDFNTLLLLFSLMAVVAGFQKLGLFSKIGTFLLSKISSARQLMLILVFLPFFFSMLITNDVALITFVPFAIVVLRLADQEKLLLPLITFQTIAANLGSMLMPMGNPQNLYLYGRSGLTLPAFIMLMLPLFLLSACILLIAACCIKNAPLSEIKIQDSGNQKTDEKIPLIPFFSYLFLLFLCILSVLKVLAPLWSAIIVSIYLLIKDRSLFRKIDYSLLATFVGFFIFIGNLSKVEAFRSALEKIITDHEVYVAILSSQVISNVPAALLLSGFTDRYSRLIIGTNLGGLGTLIASMASLISYKQLAGEYPQKKTAYFILFTVANLVMLGILLGAVILLPSVFLGNR